MSSWLIYILGTSHIETCFIHSSKTCFLKSLVIRSRTGLPGLESGFEGMKREMWRKELKNWWQMECGKAKSGVRSVKIATVKGKLGKAPSGGLRRLNLSSDLIRSSSEISVLAGAHIQIASWRLFARAAWWLPGQFPPPLAHFYTDGITAEAEPEAGAGWTCHASVRWNRRTLEDSALTLH